MQRLAHEELGTGPWSNGDGTIPMASADKPLCCLDISDPQHPVLLQTIKGEDVHSAQPSGSSMQSEAPPAASDTQPGSISTGQDLASPAVPGRNVISGDEPVEGDRPALHSHPSETPEDDALFSPSTVELGCLEVEHSDRNTRSCDVGRPLPEMDHALSATVQAGKVVPHLVQSSDAFNP